jgi:UDP-N-acetylmuramoyl-tripeptide--D-alanyl-D-alanine ligase
MLNMTEAAQLIGATRHGPEVTFNSVTTDSRAIAPGALFVALRGERFDGHDFVAAALAQGAAAALVDHAAPAWGAAPLLLAADTRLALGQLAAQWRKRCAPALAAITGSCGKTTVKEMLAAILRAQAGENAVLATAGNFNNDIGLPLTLLKLGSQHRYAVIEMGMNHPGEIAYLTRLARPDVALVNNAQPAHLEGLGSVEAVARAKGEIFEGLAADGTAVINADDPHAALWRELAGERRVLTFGIEANGVGADSCAQADRQSGMAASSSVHPQENQNLAAKAAPTVTPDVSATFTLHPANSQLTVSTPQGAFELTLPLPGAHNVRNALAATATALALGVGLDSIARGLAAVTPVKGRLQAKAALHGATLIDDTYNANPGSVRAAIDALQAMPGQRVLVLGDMGELGADGPALHRETGAYAKQRGIARLLTLGELSEQAARAFGSGGQHFETIEDLLHEAENALGPDTVMLVKGSRFMKMERVVRSLEKEAAI